MPRKPKPRPWGQVEELPSGLYRARYTHDGRRFDGPHPFDAKIDAHAWLDEQRRAIRDGRWTREAAAASVAHRGRTLGDYAAGWFETRLSRSGAPLRPRTRMEYERLLAGPLAPLAEMPLRSLTAEKVAGWYRAQLASGRATQAARAYGLLSAIVATAVRDKAIGENVCQVRGASSATTGRKVEPPSNQELQKIVETITPRYRAAVLIAAWAGTRYGELTELRRKDVHVVREGKDVRNIVIDVSRAVTQVTGHGFVVGPTKTQAGVRSISLPPHIYSDVLDHLSRHVADFPNSLLFPAKDGVTHLAESTFVKHWYPARAAARRDDLPFHGLRHYGATVYAQTGATLKEIQARLGHSTVAAAMRYQHAAGRDQELARRMSELALDHAESSR